jgi:hypothetical protein
MEHFILGHKFIASDHEVRLDDEIELAQDVLSPLGSFHVNGSRWMTELNLHAGILSLHMNKEQVSRRPTEELLSEPSRLLPVRQD